MADRHDLVAFEGVPFLGWVAPFMNWPAPLRLPFLVLLVGSLLMTAFLGGAEVVAVVGVFFACTMSGATVAVLVILVQGAHRDLASTGDAGSLAIDATTARRITVLAMLGGFLMVTWFSAAYNDDALRWLQILTPALVAARPWGAVFADWCATVALWIVGFVLVHIVLATFRQVRAFADWVSRTEIDFLAMERFQWLVWQPLRLFLITAALGALSVVMTQFVGAEGKGEIAHTLLLPLLGLAIVLGLYHLLPLFLLRARVAAAKVDEIRRVRAAIRGDRGQLRESQIAHVADEFAAPDLLAYEQRIASIREWPVEGMLLRVVLYGLLPPLAWVLGALVERVVDAMF